MSVDSKKNIYRNNNNLSKNNDSSTLETLQEKI